MSEAGAPPPMPTGAWGLLGAGGLLQLARIPPRMSEATWDYATYHLPLMAALAGGAEAEGAGVLGLQGLHPPLHALLMTAVEATRPSFAAYLLPSALATTAGATLTALAALRLGGPRAALVTAGLMAASPLLIAYGVEPLSYPLLSFGLGLLLFGSARGAALPTLIGAAIAGYAHLLGACAALGLACAWGLSPRARPSPGGRQDGRPHPAWALVLIPLYAPLALAALRAMEAGAARQPAMALGASLSIWWGRFAWAGVAEVGILTLGASLAWVLGGVKEGDREAGDRGHRPAWGALIGVAIGFVVSRALGASAGHQFPYLTAFVPPMALIAGLGFGGMGAAFRSERPGGSERPPPRTFAEAVYFGAAGLALLALSPVGADLPLGFASIADASPRDASIKDASAPAAPAPRDLPQALEDAPPSAALFLFTNHRPDDDKSLTSPTLARLGLFTALPNDEPCPVDGTDHRFGQPRRAQGHTLRLFTALFPDALDALIPCHLARGEGVMLLPYGDHAALDPGLADLARRFGAQPTTGGARYIPPPGEMP